MIYWLITINNLILLYFIISVFLYTILLGASFFTILNYFHSARFSSKHTILSSKVLPPVTIIMPIYNEKENIINALESVLRSNYTNLFAIGVNDASTDNTMEVLSQHFQLQEAPIAIEMKIPTTEVKTVYVSQSHPNLMIIDKQRNAGAGDSMNIAVNACFTPYIVSIDADSLVDTQAITEFVYDVMTHPDCVIVGGGVYILNACRYKDGQMLESKLPRHLVPAIQSLEYIRSHLFSRTGWNLFGGTVSYSGTATLFDRKTLIAVQGFDTHNYAQDAEIVMRIHAYLRQHEIYYKVLFNPAVAVWTDVPHNLREYRQQRDKWRRGLLRSVWRYKYMFFNPKYGIHGTFCFPGFIFLEMAAPLIEFTAYFTVGLAYYLHILNLYQTMLYVILAWGFVSYLSIANMFINLITFNRYQQLTDIFRIFTLAVIETFGFRQYTVLVNMYGTFHYVINRLKKKPL